MFQLLPGARAAGRRFGLLAVSLFASGLSSCSSGPSISVPGPRGSGPESSMALRELVARHALDGAAEGDVYVAFGESWDSRRDPPASFRKRLDGAGGRMPPLRPVSEAGDPTQSNPLLLVIHAPRFNADDDAVVSATLFRLGVGGADGVVARCRWRHGRWFLERPAFDWRS